MWFELPERVNCMFCDEEIARKDAREHSCEPKRAREQMLGLGIHLATWDSLSWLCEAERLEEEKQRAARSRRKHARHQCPSTLGSHREGYEAGACIQGGAGVARS